MGGLRSFPGERLLLLLRRRREGWGSSGVGKAWGLMRCSKIAIRRKMEMRMAVAAKPKEMASMDVPKFLSVVASASAAAAGSDGVSAGSPAGHGLDLRPKSLMARAFFNSWSSEIKAVPAGSLQLQRLKLLSQANLPKKCV